MDIHFIKMQSCGHDSILIDSLKTKELRVEDLPDLAAQITSRHYGVGAEDLIRILPGKNEKLKVICYKPDGTGDQPSPLSLRCAGRYAFDAGLTGGESFFLETIKAQVAIEVIDGRNIMITGSFPYYEAAKEELREKADEGFSRILMFGKKEYNYIPILFDTLHAVIFVPDFNVETQDFGSEIEASYEFDRNTEIELVRVFSREEISIKVWGIESGKILSSEHSGCAAVVASVLNGFTDREVLVHLEGGNLLIQWSGEDNRLYATGPADYVFTGTYYFEEGDNHED